MFWCLDCDNRGADPGKLSIALTYDDGISHVHSRKTGQKKFKERVIEQLAESKDLPRRAGAKQAVAFFQ
jgi:hypothetical protein